MRKNISIAITCPIYVVLIFLAREKTEMHVNGFQFLLLNWIYFRNAEIYTRKMYHVKSSKVRLLLIHLWNGLSFCNNFHALFINNYKLFVQITMSQLFLSFNEIEIIKHTFGNQCMRIVQSLTKQKHTKFMLHSRYNEREHMTARLPPSSSWSK